MISLCKNCTQKIYQLSNGRWAHRMLFGTPVTGCQESFFGEPQIAELGIEVWETESPDLFITGTEDRGVAELAARVYYNDMCLDLPEDLHEAVSNAQHLWINRDHPEYDEEIWPDDVVSNIRRDGDVPAFRYGW